MYRVLLANVGNPDLRQNPFQPLPGTKSWLWANAQSIEDASAIVLRYIADNDLGSGNWAGGHIILAATGQPAGRIWYNGRFDPDAIRSNTSDPLTPYADSRSGTSAMEFAFKVHADHRRKYTEAPYTDHLAQVAGITATIVFEPEFDGDPRIAIDVAWLHDCIEDVGVTLDELEKRFGIATADGVRWLSDLETGNRATRKRLSRERLSRAPAWVQSIKVADLISNTSSIVQHDPHFARVYLQEKRELLSVLTHASPRLLAIATEIADKS